MLEVLFKSRFKRDLKRLKSSNKNMDELINVIDLLANKSTLALASRDHTLTGNFDDF